MRTEDPEDLAYLDELLASHPKYSKYVPGPGYKRFVGSWEAVKNPEAIYIKIDDDVVSWCPAIIPCMLLWPAVTNLPTD